MGQMRDAHIEAWQERAGLTLPPAAERKAMRDMREWALKLIEILTLEESGIRDGDGYWGGSDALTGVIEEGVSLGSRLRIDGTRAEPSNQAQTRSDLGITAHG